MQPSEYVWRAEEHRVRCCVLSPWQQSPIAQCLGQASRTEGAQGCPRSGQIRCLARGEKITDLFMKSAGGPVWDGDYGGVLERRRLIGRNLEVGVIAQWT